MRVLALLLLPLMIGAGCTDDVFPTTSEERIGMPTGPNAALYLTVDGYGVDDRLIEVLTDVAERVELHKTVTDGEGRSQMSMVDGFDLPADGSLVLEPGAGHVMLVGVDSLETGDHVEVTLVWEHAGEIVSEAEVVEPAEVMGP